MHGPGALTILGIDTGYVVRTPKVNIGIAVIGSPLPHMVDIQVDVRLVLANASET